MSKYDRITKHGINTAPQLFAAMRAAAEDEDGGDELEFRFAEWLEAIDRIEAAAPAEAVKKPAKENRDRSNYFGEE